MEIGVGEPLDLGDEFRWKPGPYRDEIMQDTPFTGCYWPIDDQPACPVHGTDLIYSPAHSDWACQDINCRYGHGGAPA